MNRSALALLAIMCFGALSCKSQTQNNSVQMEKEIQSVIETFVKAGEVRNVAMYTDILHQDFRVIANRYPTIDKISILSAEGYKELITKEVIGGTTYKVIFKNIDVAEHSATVRAELKAEKGGQLVTFLLVQNTDNKWQIITDMATQIK